MKNRLLFLIISITIIAISSLNGQTYTCTVQNQTVNGSDFSFDIYIQRTDATEIYLADSEFSLTFNASNFSSPSATYSAGSDMNWYSMSVAIPSSGIVKLSVGSLLFNNQSEFDDRVMKPSTSAPGTKVATVTISSISNTSGTADLQWKLNTPHDSKVNNYLNVDPWTQTSITSNGTYNNPTPIPLPVELSTFSVNAVEGTKAQLEWETATEVNNYGFEIERTVVAVEKAGSESEDLNWKKVAFIEGHGNSNSPKLYSFTDKSLVGGSKFMYRLKQIDIDGTFEYSDAVEVEVLPAKYELLQNYPNPFNPTTAIKFSLPEDTKLAINIYNLLGERIATVLNEELKAGFHQVEFNTNSAGYTLASGVYIYTLESKNFSQVKKMILLK